MMKACFLEMASVHTAARLQLSVDMLRGDGWVMGSF